MSPGSDGAMHVLVTGATGLVGRAACHALAARGHRVTILARGELDPAAAGLPGGTAVRVVGSLEDVDWAAAGALEGLDHGPPDAVVHLAAKVHVMAPTPEDAAAFTAVNAEATEALARAAARAGARRFVFASTIKVNGEGTAGRAAYRPEDPAAPSDAYARSKHEAERRLLALGDDLEVVILRPPLVYGPGVKGNLAALITLAARPIPLPLAGGRGRRSLVGVSNLAGALVHLTEAPAEAVRGRVFLVRDGDVSTADLVGAIRRAMGRPPRLLPVPERMMRGMLKAAGLGRYGERLFGDLRVDDTALRRTGWQPTVSLDTEIGRMVADVMPDRCSAASSGGLSDRDRRPS